MQDITELKVKEKELIKSNDRYKYVSLATSDIIWDWNLKKEQVLLSENFYKVFGWELPANNKLPIKDCISYIHPEERDSIWNNARKAIQSTDSKHWKSSFRYLKANGTYAFVTLKGYIIRNKRGKSIRMIGAIQDITDKKLKERQLTESNERFDAVLKATNDLIWDWNIESDNFYRDPDGLRKVYGVANDADIKSIYTWLKRIHPEDGPHVQNIINDILHSTDQDTFEVEYRFKRDDNRYNFVYDRGIIKRNAEGRPIRMIGAAQNITERKRLEMQLLKKELDKQKLISQATIETQEQERSEISKELHDNVNQVLTTTKLYLDLSISNPEMKDELILKSTKNIIYVINEIRQLSRSLMNPSLGDLGLIESINELIENINLTGRLKARLQAAPILDEILSENQKLMVYRIVQEAINNALKHAKAQNVTIKLADNEQWIELFIEDDGIGFNFDTIKKGSGLKHIQNRVYLANGTLNVNSAPGTGCSIMINFPKHTNPI
jgi:PAS domain S-box-containing protein